MSAWNGNLNARRPLYRRSSANDAEQDPEGLAVSWLLHLHRTCVPLQVHDMTWNSQKAGVEPLQIPDIFLIFPAWLEKFRVPGRREFHF
jgi:hypothetical protein